LLRTPRLRHGERPIGRARQLLLGIVQQLGRRSIQDGHSVRICSDDLDTAAYRAEQRHHHRNVTTLVTSQPTGDEGQIVGERVSWHNHPSSAAGIGQDLRAERPDNEIAADRRQVVYRLHCGVRIVDCRRQGLQRDVDLKSDAERDVLRQRPLEPDPNISVDSVLKTAWGGTVCGGCATMCPLCCSCGQQDLCVVCSAVEGQMAYEGGPSPAIPEHRSPAAFVRRIGWC